MFNLSFWKRNSKTKEKWLQGQLEHYQCDLCWCFFGRRSHFQQQPFLISSFISHSLSHFFSKMSLAHYMYMKPHTLSLGSHWSSWPLFLLISFWSVGLNFTLPSRHLEAGQHCCCCSLSSLCSLSLCSHVNSCTRPSSIPPSLIPLMLLVPLSVVATAISFMEEQQQ